jgi:hypothetical protein
MGRFDFPHWENILYDFEENLDDIVAKQSKTLGCCQNNCWEDCCQKKRRTAIPETHETKCVYYAMCFGAILKMYPGMLSAQLLGRPLLEIEKNSNIRDS